MQRACRCLDEVVVHSDITSLASSAVSAWWGDVYLTHTWVLQQESGLYMAVHHVR